MGNEVNISFYHEVWILSENDGGEAAYLRYLWKQNFIMYNINGGLSIKLPRHLGQE